MSHTDILKRFKETCHITDDVLDCWFPNGKGSIRVRFKDRRELVFTYSSPRKWRIETVDSFVENLNKFRILSAKKG